MTSSSSACRWFLASSWGFIGWECSGFAHHGVGEVLGGVVLQHHHLLTLLLPAEAVAHVELPAIGVESLDLAHRAVPARLLPEVLSHASGPFDQCGVKIFGEVGKVSSECLH